MKPNQSICKKNSRVTTPQSHDTVSMMQQLLTRSVGVICLSRYLQHLTLTGYKTLIQPNYLTFIIYRDRKTSRTLLCKYRAIPGGPPGQLHTHNRDNQPDGLRRVTQTPSTAVPLGVTPLNLSLIHI